MSSYIYMKILESQPRRYDRGIEILSGGAAEQAKRKLVEENVSPGAQVLEIGCGTGSMAILAARAGAKVHGFDVSPGMLEVAREKVASEGLDERVELSEMGISGMDGLPSECFDLVMSTLVFSELSPDEQDYALAQAHRVLRPGARLALADEARPTRTLNRLLHGCVRLVLMVITFVLTQTTTRAVEDLEGAVTRAGFLIHKQERSALESFLYLVAKKEE
ncbi:MAG: class I SAM-dependent methyltransferase [bacterium]|nr:class I SAM-dependent methyltransferase [bacterium]